MYVFNKDSVTENFIVMFTLLLRKLVKGRKIKNNKNINIIL